jgi:hypothetical protein
MTQPVCSKKTVGLDILGRSIGTTTVLKPNQNFSLTSPKILIMRDKKNKEKGEHCMTISKSQIDARQRSGAWGQ